ncbi:glycosyltransferase [Aestuariibacter sp. AA17]|uniref:Glycosyltransferase n=1 Tax=Fluctibacter corallii TaxID=2984329 RepID=A0ABT3ADG1_9ALTE|nr:glycosyltransferase [Aestuariibacter sp. AA17]MCV2886689.1 glycosyltransferase [Aestuariibacter sp. AA17]
MLPSISVVIPTLNRDKYLIQSIRDMLQQQYDDFEIIVVDQSPAPTEDVQALIASNPDKLRYFNVDFKGLPQARNYGWQASTKDVVLYIDDDIRANEHLVAQHAECYRDASIGMVAGGIDEAHRRLDDGPRVGVFSRWSCTPYRGFANHADQFVDHVPGGNFSVRRDLIKAAGGVDEQLNLGAALYEESELSLRIKQRTGTKIFFKAQARLLHLAAEEGGCRVLNDVPKYIWGLSHNRAIVMYRYLNPLQRFVSAFALIKLVLAYSWSDRSLRPIRAFVAGFWRGRLAGKQQAMCSVYFER